MHSQDESNSRAGLSGVLKFIGVLAVLLLAVLAVLFVLDLFPRDMLREAAVKSLLVLGIVALASAAIGMLVGGPRS